MNDMITPLQDKILVKRSESETVTPEGILIPEVAQEQTCHGIVVAVGSGKTQEDGTKSIMSVKVGDKVYFTKNAVIEVMHNGSEHLMMKEDRVLLIEN